MDPQQWQRIKSAFADVIEQPQERRAALIEELCGSDTDLGREVASLVAAHEDTGTTLGDDDLTGGYGAHGSSADHTGRRFGAYRVLRLIGHGGMGTVFLAERADGEFERQVALKIVGRTFAKPELGRLLRRERQILATLSHPHIGHLLDGGVSEDGEPFFVMEFIDGVRIDQYCAGETLTTRQRLTLFLLVCRAVAHAHRQHVIHRDLKPSNILVTKDGVPKLLDFGIARLFDGSGGSDLTVTEYRAFTPDYASPEQLRGERNLTPATDVFSLGVLLNALLKDPPQELRNIIAMARRPEAERRYGSAQELADDITRYLDGRPVVAQPDSVRYRAAKFVARRRSTLVASGLVAGALVIGAVGASYIRPRVSAIPSGPASPLAQLRTVAVLPLAAPGDVSREATGSATEPPADQALRVGIADAIAARIALNRELTVRPTSATVAYLDQPYDTLTVGRELQVDGVLEGTLQSEGDELRTTLRLVDVASGALLWTGNVASNRRTVLSGPESIAARVSQMIDPDHTSDRTPVRTSEAVSSREAEDAYLRGSLALATSVRQVANIFTARDAFEQAIRLAPGVAAAHAGLANSYTTAGALNFLAPQDAYPNAERAARRALELDPDLATAHVALADIAADYTWDWEAADAGYRRAIELAPNLAMAHQTYSEFLARLGRFTEADRHSALAMQLDPTRVNYVAIRALHYYLEHRFDDAIAQGQKALARDPQTYLAYLYLATSYAARGDHAAGLEAGRKAAALTGGAVPDQFVMGCNYALMNDRRSAQAVIDRLQALSRTRFVEPFQFVALYAYLGDTDKAFEWLERSYAQRSYWMTSLKVHPTVDSLRGDPRFPEYLRRMRLE